MDKNTGGIKVWMPLIIAASLAVGIFIGSAFFGSRKSYGPVYDKIAAIMQLVEDEYVDVIDTDSLLEASITEIIEKLDPHSSYIKAEDLQAVNEDLDGSFSGIGISFNMLTDTITVLEVISGGPSEKVGLLAGDRVISINDTIVAGMGWSNEKVIKTLRGEKGSKVKLGVARDNTDKLLNFEVTRGDIPVTSIDASFVAEDGIGYVKVNKFARNTYMEFLNALVELSGKGAKKFIIDLRGNGGGFMEPAIFMANEFLEKGSSIVATHGRVEDVESEIYADGSGAYQDAELIVMLDEFSASASEIFAGAIQDNDRGLIVGRRSFGKGLVQRQIDLPDMSALRLTTARYYTPSGRCIQKPYELGSNLSYSMEIADRFRHGEDFNPDSIKFDATQTFKTLGGRTVYGGGGIMPDIYVPNDTTGITSYYIDVFNAGLLQKFAFNYANSNRNRLRGAKSVKELLTLLPSDDTLIQDFADYAYKNNKIAPRWYYINISRDLIVNQLKALIARDALGTSAYYEVISDSDKAFNQAKKQFSTANTKFPVVIDKFKSK
ncbi:MAG: S41 family peptidase [Bacteroides sp.]|nr:S41 family peptidase [Bacteroides sp.]MCM1477853.1 S41 family peptidase [Bacteroides sp.]